MTVESTIKRAEKEVSEGRLWRAKEILGSSISTYGYSREIFRKLAEVLLNMGEIPEAGKYLLLSTDCPTEEELSAIKVFFRRCHHNNYHQLFGKFPSVARLENREEYPEHLRNHLTEIGMPKSIRKNRKRQS